MEEMKIKVSTDVLKSKAATVDGLIRKMDQQYDELYRHIKNVARYWKGEASEKSMERCEEDRKLVMNMLHRLMEYPVDLREMAGIYETGEKQANDATSSLPFDVII